MFLRENPWIMAVKYVRNNFGRLIRWLLVAQLSALITVATYAIAQSNTFDFGDSDGADTRIDMNVQVTLNLSRKIAVSEMNLGHIVLRRSPTSISKEVKGYCVRANYDGRAGLRIVSKNQGDNSTFALENADRDTIPLTVAIQDALAGSGSQEVQPNEDVLIKTLQAASCDKATTNLEVSVNFDQFSNKSGVFETTLGLIFVAK